MIQGGKFPTLRDPGVFCCTLWDPRACRPALPDPRGFSTHFPGSTWFQYPPSGIHVVLRSALRDPRGSAPRLSRSTWFCAPRGAEPRLLPRSKLLHLRLRLLPARSGAARWRLVAPGAPPPADALTPQSSTSAPPTTRHASQPTQLPRSLPPAPLLAPLRFWLRFAAWPFLRKSARGVAAHLLTSSLLDFWSTTAAEQS